MNSDDFGEDIVLKLYLKYKYQEVSKGPKKEGKEAFLNAINDFSNHLYIEKSRKERGHCWFYIKKSNKETEKKENLPVFSPYLTFSLNEAKESEISEEKKLKRKQFLGKHIKRWCKEYKKFIYKEC